MLDIVLAVILLIAAIGGWQRGLVSSALGLACFVIGIAVGLWLSPQVLAFGGLQDADPPVRAFAQLVVVLVVVGLMTALGEWVAHSIMRGVGAPSVRFLDSFTGVLASVVVTALVLWLMAAAVRPAVPAVWSQAMAESRVLTTLDAAVPEAADDIPERFRSTLQAGVFPDVFGGGREPELQASAPPSDDVNTPGVQAATDSVVKIRSGSAQCRLLSSGSGWTVAEQRVVTNAHVVAGGREITVQVGGEGRRLEATVVAYDPGLDLAVLAVPGLRADPLERVEEVDGGTEGVVAGFPGGGDYTLTPAWIGSPLQARGLDIYDDSSVERQIYPVRADVRSGDSGGPLLTLDGQVAGTVFAKSTDREQTGYALTDAATARWLDQASSLREPVSTGACTT